MRKTKQANVALKLKRQVFAKNLCTVPIYLLALLRGHKSYVNHTAVFTEKHYFLQSFPLKIKELK